MEKKDQDAHTTAYSAIPAISATTERIAEATDWESLEQIWKVLQKSPEDAPEWENFWKSLDDWARDNINQGALPKVEWNRMQVAAWARKVLKFDNEDAAALTKAKVNGDALFLVPSYDWLEKKGIAPGTALRLWAAIEKMKKSLAEPDSQSTTTESPSVLKKIEEMIAEWHMFKQTHSSTTRGALLLDSTFSQVYHHSEQYSSTKSSVVMESMNMTVPTILKPFDINDVNSENEQNFVLQLADKIKSNIATNQQKLHLHVTQNKKFSGFSRRPDMVLTLRSASPVSVAEIVVWIELKINDNENEAMGQLISGLTRLHKEAQSSREVFYGGIINRSHVKLMKYTMTETGPKSIVWADCIPWGLPDVKQDEAIKTLLRLINTPAESLGYRQMHYDSKIIVPKVLSPAFTANSLVLYDLQPHRYSLKRPDIVKVSIERSDIHSTKEKKRPTALSGEILQGAMKVGNIYCTHEILRERQALTLLNPSTVNLNKYIAKRQKMAFIPELLGTGTLSDNDHEYNVTAPFGIQLDEITTMIQFNQVLTDINQALRVAHKKKIFHADVSVKNIILTEKGNAVLIDWGFSFIAGQEKLSRGFTGTPLFASIRITQLLNTERTLEYCARDDFEALFYVLLYCTSGKKLPWSKSNSQELFVGKQLAMTANWKATLSHAAPIFHEKIEQMHRLLFPENLYDETLEVNTLCSK